MSFSNLEELSRELESLIITDPNDRGIKNLLVEGDLYHSIAALKSARTIAITTGMPCFPDNEQKGETDGLPGALAITQAVTRLGTVVHFIVDDRDLQLTLRTVEIARQVGILTDAQYERISVLGYDEIKDRFNPHEYDCFIAIERCARSMDGRCYSMKGVDLTPHCDPIDDLFEKAAKSSSCTTIGIGDGGNELGLGKVQNRTAKHVSLGEKIGAAVSADLVVICGVSNWGGYSMAATLYAETKRQPASLGTGDVKIEEFVPTPEQTDSLLGFLNEQGVRDGLSGRMDKSVDGLPLSYHLQMVEKIVSMTMQY